MGRAFDGGPFMIMSLFSKKLHEQDHVSGENRETPMVRKLTEIWDIHTEPEAEDIPSNVSSDIYAMMPKNRSIPRRYHGRRVE